MNKGFFFKTRAMAKNLNRNLNKGKARKADNIRLCRELLKKGNTQREIAKILNVSLPTANAYCQEIAQEIENAHKEQVQEAKEKRRRTLDRTKRAKLAREQQQEEQIETQTPEELAKAGFTACLRELQLRLPEMTNEEVMKITVDLWDRVNK